MAPGLISIEAQVAAMAARWPTFSLVNQSDRSAVWEGRLEPVRKSYLVRIAYRVPAAPEAFSLVAIQPRVQVLDPPLERHPDYEQGPIPHVYRNRSEPELPFLCLFDPYNREWTPSDLLAETTVPWTARNLFFYEGWLVTKRWRGGGRHPTREERNGVDPADKSISAV